MKKQDFLITIACLIFVAAAVFFFVKGVPFARRPQSTASVNAEEIRMGDKICYAAATEPEHLQEHKETGMLYADNEMILQLSALLDEESAAALAQENGADLVGFISVSGTCQWRFSGKHSLEELEKLANDLAERPEIEAAYLNTVFEERTTEEESKFLNHSPDVPEESKAFNRKLEAHWGYADIHAKAAYDAREKMTTPVNIGIYDSVFTSDSTELGNMIVKGTVFEGEDSKKVDAHGTHVAGIAAARNGNQEGIAGVYPCPGNAQIYAASWHTDSYTPGDTKDGKSRMQELRDFAWFLYHDVKVINCSFALSTENIHRTIHEIENGSGKMGEYEYYLLRMPAECYTIFFDRFIDAGYEFLIVSSAGNDSARTWLTRKAREKEEGGSISATVVEAKYVSVLNYISKKSVKNRIIVVGNYDKDHQVNAQSNLGERTDIMAPGTKIYSTIGNGKYKNMTGTSQAAPYVTGTIASIWALDSSRSASEVRAILFRVGTVIRNEDLIKDSASGREVLKLDVKKSLTLATKGETETVADEKAQDVATEIVQIRVFLQNKDSFRETKAANVTVIGESGTVYYDRERIAYPAEESMTDVQDKFTYYGYGSAFFLPIPNERIQVRIEADGIEEIHTVDGLDPTQDYYEQEGIRRMAQEFINDSEDIPQWTFVIQTRSEEVNPVQLLVSDKDRLQEFIAQQNFRIIPTGTTPAIPSSAWTGAADPGWTKEDITGVLSMDIADYDSDNKKELLVLSLETHEETWYGATSQVTDLILQMYEVSGSKVFCAAEHRVPVSRTYLQTLIVSDQMNCFTFENGDGIAIVLDCHQWAGESAQVTNSYRYDGNAFLYERGTALLTMGEGDLYLWTARSESDGLSATQAVNILSDPGKWDLQQCYLAEEYDWRYPDEQTIKDYADRYFIECCLTKMDPRIYSADDSSDFVTQYNKIHAVTAREVYENAGLRGYHYLCTLFVRHQLEKDPEWALICTDESMANSYR